MSLQPEDLVLEVHFAFTPPVQELPPGQTMTSNITLGVLTCLLKET
jgi:hypothetical protein